MAKKHIAIVGAGFAGLTCALRLAKKLEMSPEKDAYRIILIDRNQYQLFAPSLYEIASIPKEYADDRPLASSLLFPIEDILQGTSIVFFRDEYTGGSPENRKIFLRERGEFPYAYLVLALGAETNYFDIPGLAAHSIPLKTAHDAVRLRNAVENGLKERERLKIVIGGAGASGVELAAEFINYLCLLKEKILPAETRCAHTLILVEASPAILPGFDPRIVRVVQKRLERLGITIKTDAQITKVDDHCIFFKGERKESYDILIWTGGVKGPSVLARSGLPLSPKGGIVVDQTLEAKGAPFVFAIGDNAAFVDTRTGKPLPWVAPVAEAHAYHVARAIFYDISGKKKRAFTPLKKYPFVLTAGKKYAVADFTFFKCWGILGWIAKIFTELRYLLSIFPPRSAFRVWKRHIALYRAND